MKKKLSLFLMAIMVIVLSFSLVACSGGDDSSSKPTTPDTTVPEITGVTFNDSTVNYDGTEHQIEVSNLPQGATVTYTNNKGTDAGTYNATATVKKEGFKDLTLNAKLVINKLDMSADIKLEGSTANYTGHEQKIEVVGALPEGAVVTYEGGEDKNKATNAGTYNIKATITCKNYNTKVLTAKLVINKIDMAAELTFANETFEYDGKEHKITIEGLVPEGAKVVYEGGENGKNGATNLGKYTITATVTGPNYNNKVLTATLTIKTTEEDLNVVLYNDNLYFQNPLHNNYFYSYDGASVEFVSYDSPISYAEANGKLYFFSKGLLSTSLCSFDGAEVNTLLEVNGDNLITDGTNLYYSCESLITPENNGIYKVSIADVENTNVDPQPTRITSSRADCMVYANGYIYFANKDDGKKLYRTSTEGSTATLVYDYKVSELVASSNVLYFTRHHNLTAAIYSIDVNASLALPLTDESTKVQKITTSKGKNLTVIGEYVYFMNTDMLTSTIYGDGIYRAKTDGTDWKDTITELVGKNKVIDGSENAVYALTGNSQTLYYYKAGDKHLYSYDITEETETDVMETFTPPVVPHIITTYYEKSLVHNGELYYINMNDGGKLYKYNVDNNCEFRMTGLQVADFTINGDYLYFASVRFMVNYDLYRLNLINGELVRLSTDKCYYLTFTEDWIYYLNFSKKNSLNRMKYDGTSVEVLVEDVADVPITLKDNKVYFVINSLGHDKMLTYDITTKEVLEVNEGTCSPGEYIIVDNKLIVVNLAYNNKLEIRDLKTKAILNSVKLGTDDARGLFVVGNDLYFYRNIAAGSTKKGLYKLDLTDNTAKEVLVDDMVRDGKAYNVTNVQLINGKLYFLDVWQALGTIPNLELSTGKLCSYDFTTKTIEELN